MSSRTWNCQLCTIKSHRRTEHQRFGRSESPKFSSRHNFDLLQPTRILSHLHFTPNSLTHLPVGINDTLIAASGQDSEIHLSLHTSSYTQSNQTRQVWEYENRLSGSINNSVLLTSLSLTETNESGVEPRVGVSNNDGFVKLYDIPMSSQQRKEHFCVTKILFTTVFQVERTMDHKRIFSLLHCSIPIMENRYPKIELHPFALHQLGHR